MGRGFQKARKRTERGTLGKRPKPNDYGKCKKYLDTKLVLAALKRITSRDEHYWHCTRHGWPRRRSYSLAKSTVFADKRRVEQGGRLLLVRGVTEIISASF